jgi:O-antigen ligase
MSAATVLNLPFFLILFFVLPHSWWIPVKLGISPDDIPLGLVNEVLIVAFGLWLVGKLRRPSYPNPFKAYTAFLVLVVLGTGIALAFGHAESLTLLVTPAKRELCLLLLYFVPLAAVKDARDFKRLFLLLLLVHFAVGYETLSSGVLGGSAFNDTKRGSGPFGRLWTGSDVAGAYLAQVLMYFLALALFEGTGLVTRVAAMAGAGIVFLGILATYSRGSLVAAAAGGLLIVLLRKLRVKTLIVAVVLCAAVPFLVPESTKTRLGETTNEEGSLDESSAIRLLYYEVAWDIFKDHPLGVGTGQARTAMSDYLPLYLDPRTMQKGGAYGTEFNTYVDPHNGYLYTLVEHGVPGLVIFLWMLGAFFWKALRLYHDAEAEPIHRAYGLGTMGFVGALAVCNLFYANFYKELVLGTLVLHLGLMACAQAHRERTAAVSEDDEALAS